MEKPFAHLLDLFGGTNRLNFDYIAETVKSRCVARIVNIACIIN
jgi:hypothetical protein